MKSYSKNLESLEKFLLMLKEMNPLTSFTFNSLATDWGKKWGYHVPYITIIPILLVKMGLLQREKTGRRYFYVVTNELKSLNTVEIVQYTRKILTWCNDRTITPQRSKPTKSPKVLKSESTLDLLKSKDGYIMLGDYIITGDNITLWKKLS